MGRKRGKNGVPLPLGGKDGPKELYWGREGTSPEKDKVAAEPENDSFEKTKKVKMEVVEKLEGPRGKRRRKEAAVKDVVEVKVEKNGEVVVKEEKDAKEIARLKETKEERRKKILQKMKALGAKKGHPLLDEEILVKLWSLYPPTFGELQNIRLVCTKWASTTLVPWRSSVVVNLIPESQVFTTPNIYGIRPTELLSRINDPQDPYRLNKVPFKKYQFSGFQLDLNSEGQSAAFWDQVGVNITYLHLNTCEFLPSVDSPFASLVVDKLPKLEELHITETGLLKFPRRSEPPPRDKKYPKKCTAVKLSIVGYIPCKLQELLGLFPDMKELTLRNGKNAKYSSNLLTILSELRRDSNFLKYNLEKLDIKGSYVISNPIINPLSATVDERWKFLRCGFKTLSLELTPIERANSILQPLLLANQNVESLELCIIPRYPVGISRISDQFYFQAPMMHLTKLTLWGNTIHSFEFLKFMPNLKRLYCNPLCFQRWTGRGKHHQPCTNDLVKTTRQSRGDPIMLKDMEELWIDHELTPTCLKKLTGWMPNLKRLKTVLNKTTFQIVSEKWPGLVQLGLLFGSELHDEMIVGKSKRGRGRKSETVGGILSSFTDLNVFTYDEYCDASKLTDNCVPGLIKLKNLVHLKICVTDRLTLEGEAVLKENIGWCEVIRNGGDGPHSNYNCCLRKRFLTKAVASGDIEEDDDTEDEALLSDEETDDSDEEEGVDDFLDDDDDSDDDPDMFGVQQVRNFPFRGYIPVLVAMQRLVNNNMGRRRNLMRLRNLPPL